MNNKVDKTVVSEAVENTTAVVNVPEKSLFVGVTEIQGKTRKTKNLSNFEEMLVKSGISKDSNGYFSGTNNELYRKIGNIDINSQPYEANRVYTLSAIAYYDDENVSTGNTRFDVHYTDGTSASMYIFSTSTNINRKYLKTNGKTVEKIVFTYDTVSSKVFHIKDFMLELDGYISPYEPYGELWNTPVESIVSVGKNLAKLKMFDDKSKMDIYGAIAGGKYLPAGTYTLSYQSDYIAFLQIYEAITNKQYASDITAKNYTITLPDGYYKVYFYKTLSSNGGLPNANIRNLQFERSDTVTDYSEHFEISTTVPYTIQSLPDWGCAVSDTVYNWIDFESGVYHHNVGSVDLGTLTWVIHDTDRKIFRGAISNLKSVSNNELATVICGKYKTVKGDDTWISGDISTDINTKNVVFICDSSYSTALDFKTAVSGVMLNYELETQEIIDISDIIRPIKTEPGGTITFVTEHGIDMNNTIKFKKEV